MIYKKDITAEEFPSLMIQYHTLDGLNFPVLQGTIGGSDKTFKNCHFEGFTFQISCQSIEFSNCTFKTLHLQPVVGILKITINNCQIEEFSISSSTQVVTGNIDITVTGTDTVINTIKWSGETEFRKITFDGIKKIDKANLDVKCHYLTIKNCNDFDYIILEGTVRNTINVSNCRNFSFFVIRNLETTTNRIEVTDSEGMCVDFNSAKAKYINFTRCQSSSLTTAYLKADNINLDDSSFSEVILYHDCDFNLTSRSLNNKRLSIDRFVLASSKLNKERVFTLDGIDLGELSIGSIHNEGLINLLNVNLKNRLELFKSNLGKFQLTGVDLDKNCGVHVLDCNINDVMFNSVRWNKNYQLSEAFDNWTKARYNSEDSFLNSLRESYRQLKSNYLKGGNKIESLEFQKGEMNTHYQILRKGKFKSWRNYGNYLIVATNKWFSDFGQNIWKPIVWLFLTQIIIFNGILYSFDLGIGIAMSGDAIDYAVTWKAVNLFFNTLLPTHSVMITDIDGNPVSIGGIWDFLGRIMSSYFIYYFISASRKYHQ